MNIGDLLSQNDQAEKPGDYINPSITLIIGQVIKTGNIYEKVDHMHNIDFL